MGSGEVNGFKFEFVGVNIETDGTKAVNDNMDGRSEFLNTPIKCRRDNQYEAIINIHLEICVGLVLEAGKEKHRVDGRKDW
jgi:hypothetical protein